MNLDLDPHEWKSERDKPKEPFFGPGLPAFILLCIQIVAVAYIKRYWLP